LKKFDTSTVTNSTLQGGDKNAALYQP
jgi:hypothetical protein